jgi:hypothetical protein
VLDDAKGLDAAVQAEIARQQQTSKSAQNYGQYATANFTPEDYLANQDPGYAFSMSEGLKALDRTAAARGGALSGGAIKGALQYSQGLASQDYQNAFNRYQTQRSNTLNPYQQLQGVGQAAAAGQAANLGALGSAQQQAITGAANATSAGQIAGANTAAGGINSGVNALTNLLASRQSSYTQPNYFGADAALNNSLSMGSGTLY